MATIDNNVDHLQWEFRTKTKVFLECIHKKIPTVQPFETLRTKTRQVWLYATGKSKTLNSKHLKWLACDFVFMKNGQPTWAGNYAFLHWVWVMCGMDHLSWEQCHLEDGLPIKIQMQLNSARYQKSTDEWEKQRLHDINECFRKHWY